MITSFVDKDTEAIFFGTFCKRLPHGMQASAHRKLVMIHAAIKISDLQAFPGLRCKKMTGKLAKFWSLRINDQWRILFKWNELSGEASEVGITDYH